MDARVGLSMGPNPDQASDKHNMRRCSCAQYETILDKKQTKGTGRGRSIAGKYVQKYVLSD